MVVFFGSFGKSTIMRSKRYKFLFTTDFSDEFRRNFSFSMVRFKHLRYHYHSSSNYNYRSGWLHSISKRLIKQIKYAGFMFNRVFVVISYFGVNVFQGEQVLFDVSDVIVPDWVQFWTWTYYMDNNSRIHKSKAQRSDQVHRSNGGR